MLAGNYVSIKYLQWKYQEMKYQTEGYHAFLQTGLTSVIWHSENQWTFRYVARPCVPLLMCAPAWSNASGQEPPHPTRDTRTRYKDEQSFGNLARFQKKAESLRRLLMNSWHFLANQIRCNCLLINNSHLIEY